MMVRLAWLAFAGMLFGLGLALYLMASPRRKIPLRRFLHRGGRDR